MYISKATMADWRRAWPGNRGGAVLCYAMGTALLSRPLSRYLLPPESLSLIFERTPSRISAPRPIILLR